MTEDQGSVTRTYGRVPLVARAKSASDDLPAGTQLGNFVILEQIGSGGMSTVYLAEHPQLDQRVAIKVLAAELCAIAETAERFLAEAQLVSRLRHPNIIEIFDFGRTTGGQPYYVMEYLDGRDLAEAVEARGGTLPPEAAAEYLAPICAALTAAHERGVVHRDLKPENIYLIDEAPYLKLLDFGLAKLLSPRERGVQLTKTGVLIGSGMTISPEQAAGRSSLVGPQADLYALGVLLYWMLSGRPPFSDERIAVLLAKHIEQPPLPLAMVAEHVPKGVAAVVDRCLLKDPADRPHSASAVLRAFELALREGDPNPWATIGDEVRGSREATADPREGSERPRRRPALVALIVLSVLALGAAAYFVTAHDSGRATPRSDRDDRPENPAAGKRARTTGAEGGRAAPAERASEQKKRSPRQAASGRPSPDERSKQRDRASRSHPRQRKVSGQEQGSEHRAKRDRVDEPGQLPRERRRTKQVLGEGTVGF